MLTVVQLGFERVQARLALGQLGRTLGAAVAHLGDQLIALLLDPSRLLALVLDLGRERFDRLAQRRQLSFHGRIGVEPSAGGFCSAASTAACSSARVACSVDSMSASSASSALIRSMSPELLLDGAVAGGDALVDRQRRLSLGQFTFPPGQPGLTLGEHDLCLLLQGGLFSLQTILRVAEVLHSILHGPSQAAYRLLGFGLRIGIAHGCVTSSDRLGNYGMRAEHASVGMRWAGAIRSRLLSAALGHALSVRCRAHVRLAVTDKKRPW